ncbi:hypothetical protein BH24ACI4_BH24ACI4_22800 [soil metagenome]
MKPAVEFGDVIGGSGLGCASGVDVQMPDMNGFEATAAIRRDEASTGRRTRIVAMTAHPMKGDRERCVETGMDDYISKPIAAALLAQVIERVTSGSLGGAA